MTILQRKLEKLFLTTQEKPASEPEKNVTDILFSFMRAMNSRDIDLVCTFFSPTATIDSITKGTAVDVATYRELSRPIIKHLEYFFYDDVMIRPAAPEIFIASGVARFRAKRTYAKELCLEFSCSGTRWLITKFFYV